ncbi:NTF2-like N-terminal transpeptidase domain-containing protein [Paenibacillus sp.]|jgi:penicillin-binding protein|uniref:NTF2-like N-terminal transpeptidase domain-containing protein n=1 Tax=Paenibacillus sp. TaxID=58172 RepID=UPI002824D155|nr:NTF2-like N-terminal transpeptidase domain-containing protein [Paenibacillus sp.]MDR0268126.1 hypothetical protein [Paenibacillus sp.]
MRRTQVTMYGLLSVLAASVLAMYVYFFDRLDDKPDSVVQAYFLSLKDQDFEKVYSLMSVASLKQSGMTREQFIHKYKSNLREMGVSSIEVNAGTPIQTESTSDYTVDYSVDLHTFSGEILENHKLKLIQENSSTGGKWKIWWRPELIFP